MADVYYTDCTSLLTTFIQTCIALLLLLMSFTWHKFEYVPHAMSTVACLCNQKGFLPFPKHRQ